MGGEAPIRDVILRDGTTLRLRPPAGGDAGAVLDFFEGLSERSLYLRFHERPVVDEALAEAVLDPDWDGRGSLVGVVDGRVVALASWARLHDPRRAEVAFAVDDAFQGRGIGTRLVEQLANLAAEHGIETFVAEVLVENAAMLRVFQQAGFELTHEREADIVEVAFPVNDTEAFRAHVDVRDHVSVVASLRPFFSPESVAVLGASAREGSIGRAVLLNVVEGGYAGRVYAVNRRGEDVMGVRGFDSVAALPEAVDLAVVCLPAEVVVEAVEETVARGTRAVCVISAGFAETGPEGAEREVRLLAAARASGARLLGPNCLGLSVAGPSLNATFAPRAFPPGPIGFASQSGAIGLALLERARERGLGFSSFVSMGNKADISSNDLLEHWENDEETSLVALYVESFGNPRKFSRIARRVSGKKPVLAIKSGGSGAGARAASSHTAALAGSEAAVDALFREAGVIRSASLEELLDVATLLVHEPLPQGRRVAILTNAGGLGILCADALEGAGLEVPRLADATADRLREILPEAASAANPVDLLGSATADLFERSLPPLLADESLDAVVVLFVPAAHVTARDVAAAIDRAGAERAKPAVRVLLAEDRLPGSLPYPESAARALARAAERAEWLRRPVGSVPALTDVNPTAARAVMAEALGRNPDAWLDPGDARDVLEAYGIPLVAERTADTVDDAVAAAEELGFPVVVKTAAPGAHKTETGGIALDLASAGEVREAAERIGPPVIVQRMAEGEVELLAGAIQDPVFGPLVAFGPGGVLAELIGAATFRLAPITDVDASELVTGGKAGRLVAGFRGKPPADAAALADLLHRLGRLAADLPEVAELDLNPVLAGPDGCVAVDARVRVAEPADAVRLKTW